MLCNEFKKIKTIKRYAWQILTLVMLVLAPNIPKISKRAKKLSIKMTI
jgi:hypothetical protein